MEKEEKIAAIRDRARKNFSKGYNCAECVLEAFLEYVDTGLPKEAMKMVTGFGGGVGLYGDTCGAITGAIMAVGAVHGRDHLPEAEDRKEAMKLASRQLYGQPGLYRLFNLIPNRVSEKYGNTLCREICHQWKETWLCREHALHCREIITDTAELAAKIAFDDLNRLMSMPFGNNVENLKDTVENCDEKG